MPSTIDNVPCAERYTDDTAPEERALIDELRAFGREVVAVTGTPGLNVAIALKGRLVWEAGIGWAELAAKASMTPDSITRAASVAKLYTTTAALMLVEEGRIGLYEPIATYLPDLPIENPHGARAVTLYDLLTFQSGLSADTGGCRLGEPQPLPEYLSDAYREPRLQEYGGVFPRWSARVGDRFQYSNLGIATVGYIVERVNGAGLTFSDFVAQRIIEPLGLSSTAFPPSTALGALDPRFLSALSTGYAHIGHLRTVSPPISMSAYPSGGLLTTAGDQVRLLLTLSTGANSGQTPLLRPETIRFMRTPQRPVTAHGGPSDWFVGLGLMMGNLRRPDYCFGYDGAYF
jgi:CubicO group peptidase (beta-lactamase class C family)